MISFAPKCVLFIGATSGIGAALADRLIAEGSKVIAVGRRQDKLDEFVRRHGSKNSEAIRFDVTARDRIGQFVNQSVPSPPQTLLKSTWSYI